MKQGIWRNSPALLISALALFVALGGSVYAAKRARINGRAIRAKSEPGNRLKPHSLPANRLKRGLLRRLAPTGPLTGADINELTLGQVPSAAHAESAETAQSANDAQTAVNAVNAVNAETVNGHGVGCRTETRLFAGACWETSANPAATAPEAAARCAAAGGTLPSALELAAFAEEPDVNLDARDEWSGDVTNVSGEDLYSVVTVSGAGAVNYALSTNTHPFRCVIPLVT